jgi:hypothetical protein
MINERITRRIWSIFGQVEKLLPPGVTFQTHYGTDANFAKFTMQYKTPAGCLHSYQFSFLLKSLDFDGRDPQHMNDLTYRVEQSVRLGLVKLGLI